MWQSLHAQSRSLLASTACITLLLLASGCSNSGEEGPVIPLPRDPGSGQGNNGGGIDFTPFEDLRATNTGIIDLDFEGDGDVVVYDSQGWKLYTAGGVFKRQLQGGQAVGLSSRGSGRGICYLSLDANCSPAGVDDDAFVTGGHNCVTVNAGWYGGTADPIGLGCTTGISAQFGCPGAGQGGNQNVVVPSGFQHHPVSTKPYWRASFQQLTVDNDNDGGAVPCNANPPNFSGFGTIQCLMAYDQRAPFMDNLWNMPGFSDLPAGDFSVWVQKSVSDQIQGLAMVFPAYTPWATGVRVIAFDRVPPTPFTSGESPRSGVNTGSITDFAMDGQNRFIFVHPSGNTVTISEPHNNEANHIIIQKELGGLQNGDGTGPLDFQGPRSVAIDPRTQDILIADTGHDRVVVFTSSGEYKRQFVTGRNPYIVRVDSFSRIFVVTQGVGNDGTGGGLDIYDQFGKTPIFGSIEGLVRDSRNNRGISRALVRINYPTSYGVVNPNPNDPQPNPFLSQQVLTEDSGYFRFSQVVLADQLGLTATRPGFVDATVSVDVTPGQTTTVEIVMVPQNTSSPGFGVVTGTLLSNANGSPLANFNVGVQGTGISDRSNGNGEFMILGVPAGTVTLVISANGVTVHTVPGVQVADGQTKSLGAIRIDI